MVTQTWGYHTCFACECTVLWFQSQIHGKTKGGTFMTRNTKRVNHIWALPNKASRISDQSEGLLYRILYTLTIDLHRAVLLGGEAMGTKRGKNIVQYVLFNTDPPPILMVLFTLPPSGNGCVKDFCQSTWLIVLNIMLYCKKFSFLLGKISKSTNWHIHHGFGERRKW